MSLFVNDNYKNFKYFVSASDNYVVLTNQRNVYGEWQNPQTYDVIYQYLIPSTLVIESERSTTSSQTFQEIETSQHFWDRSDSPIITIGSFVVLFFLLFVINGLTKLVRKGGVFFGS